MKTREKVSFSASINVIKPFDHREKQFLFSSGLGTRDLVDINDVITSSLSHINSI